jgi:hypothetical protein
MNFEDIKIEDYITVTRIKDRYGDNSFNGEIFKVMQKENPYLSCDRIYPVGLTKIINLNRYEVMVLSKDFVKSIEDSRLQQLRSMMRDYLGNLLKNNIL